jgi:hypothetical protein
MSSDVGLHRVMLILQLIIAFQSQLDNTAILSRPKDVLEFVRHALDVSDTPSPVLPRSGSGTSKSDTNNERRKGLFKEDLRFIPEEQDAMETEEDSDDEVEVEGENMVETAVGLLLAVLEGSFLFASSRCNKDWLHFFFRFCCISLTSLLSRHVIITLCHL